MSDWHYDPATVNVGDTLFMRVPYGFSSHVARRYKVTKKTPTGQVTAENEVTSVRITPAGKIVGDDGWRGRHVISEADALVLEERERMENAWRAVSTAAASVDGAAHRRDRVALAETMTRLQAAVAALLKGTAA